MVDLAREVIAMAARGFIAAEHAATIERDAAAIFDRDETREGSARLLAWTCAVHVFRALGRRTDFFAVRLALATMPRLDLPLDVWTELQRDTRRELDLCEALDTFDPGAPERLATTTPKQEDEHR